VRTGIRFSRSHARAVRASWRIRYLRVDARGDLDVDQHHHGRKISASRSARRYQRRSAIARAINRAGYFVMPMDETLASPAIDLGGRPARRRRSQVKAARVGDLQDRAGCTTSSGGFALGARGNVHVKVALRPLEPPQDRSGVQGLRARAARRLREGQAARKDAAEHEGPSCDRADRLQGREPDVGVKKALATIGAEVIVPQAPEELADAAGVIVPGVGHFGATRALDGAWIEAILGRCRRGGVRCSGSVSACSAVRGERRGAGAVRPRPLERTMLSIAECIRENPARRLEQLIDRARRGVDPRGRAVRLAGLLHAQLRRAGDRRFGGGH